MGTPWQILRVSGVGLAVVRLPVLPLPLLAPCFVPWANRTATINVAVVTREKATRKTNATRSFIVANLDVGVNDLLRGVHYSPGTGSESKPDLPRPLHSAA